jgi:hypothetical protein
MKLVMEYFKTSAFEEAAISECHEYESKEAFLADFDIALCKAIQHQKDVHAAGHSGLEPIIFEFDECDYHISDFSNYYSDISKRRIPIVKELNEWFDYNIHRRLI